MYTVLLFTLYNHISFLPLTLRETRLNLNGFFMEIYMIFRYSSLRINLQDIGTAYIFFFIRKDSLSDIIQLRRGTEKRMSEKKAIICIHYAFYVVSVFLHLIQRNNRASNLSFICKGGILMSTSAENRGQFGSKLGFILSAAGSAVGLLNPPALLSGQKIGIEDMVQLDIVFRLAHGPCHVKHVRVDQSTMSCRKQGFPLRRAVFHRAALHIKQLHRFMPMRK